MGWPCHIPARGSRRFDVVGLGENCVDHYCLVPALPAPGGKVRMLRHEVQGGGQIASAMLCCQRLGLAAGYLGRCGSDAESRAGIAELAAAGVVVSGVRVCSGERSQLSIILVDAQSGERAIAWSQGSALALRPDELCREEIACARVLHVDLTSPAAAARAVALARAAGVATSIDADHPGPELAALLSALDLCVLPQALAAALTGESDPERAVTALGRLCPGCLRVVTCGPRGCVAQSGATTLAVPAFPVRAVDTTGCGDVFHAALIVAACEDQPLPDALRFASAAAALNTRALGGRAALPTRAAIAEVLRTGVVPTAMLA